MCSLVSGLNKTIHMQKKVEKGKTGIVDYPDDVSRMLFELEPSHFWFQGRNRIISLFIDKVIDRPKGMTFLEVGCGTGFVLSFMEQKGFKVEGTDILSKSLKLARLRTRAKLICGDFRKIHFAKKYDVIGMFDVIEHIEDDGAFLNKSANLLKQDGFIVITVPANMLLWSQVDKISGHKRRYNKKNLSGLLENSGFNIEAVSYYNFFLFFPQLLLRKFMKHKESNNKILLEGGLRKLPFLVNFIFTIILSIERGIMKYSPLPFGASLIIIGKKRNEQVLV